MTTPRRPVHLLIDRVCIAEHDTHEILAPTWWSVDIYEGLETYRRTCAAFSREQQIFNAVRWYEAEVCNGGHDQFYSNSTGIVWEDALAGLDLASLEVPARLLRESAVRMGGSPSFDREERNLVLDRFEPDFEDLDSAFYEDLRQNGSLDDRLLPYIRAHPDRFLFQGVILMPSDGDGGLASRISRASPDPG